MQRVKAPSNVGNRISQHVVPGFSFRNLLLGFFFMANFCGSEYSIAVSGTTLAILPAAPANLTATVVSSSAIDLTWEDKADNEEGFKIERGLNTAGPYTLIATPGPNFEAFSDTGLAGNTKYFYRISAFNSDGQSAYSAVVTATTLPVAPKTPGNLTAAPASSSQINLAWQDNSDNEAGFRIERKTLPGTYQQVALVGANVTSYASATLSPNTKYFFRVRAFNAGGQSDYANEVSVTTLPRTPAAPGNLTATTVSNTKINLAWQDNSANEDSFKIERKKGAAGKFAQIARPGANVKKFADSSLTANTAYFYRVAAANAGGHSDYSSEASATTLPDKPGAPDNLLATTISHAQINLAWQDKAANEDSFKIERKIGAAGKFVRIAAVAANVKKFSDKELAPKTEYFYRLRAANNGGFSDYSNEASATTFPLPPGAPGNLTATTMSNSRIALAWRDNSANEDGFKLERKKAEGGVYAPIALVGPNVKKFADSTLAANTLYFYRIRAFNTGNHSDYSNEASAMTLPDKPAAPDNLIATTMSHTQINLAWQDNAANEDSFKIERKAGAAGKFFRIAAVGANVKKFSDKELAPKTEYFYRLRAANNGGFSDYSNEASATTFPLPPGAPGNLTATTVSNSRITLAWQDNSANEEGFKLERKKGAVGAYAQIALLGPDAKKFADSTLTANSLYFYRIRSFNTGNHSDYSSEASATTLPDKPAPPNGLTATTISHAQINLAWQDNATNEDSFKIERKAGAAGKFFRIAAVGANVKKFSDKELAPKTEYFYRLRAANNGGFSDYSNEASATTFPVPPGAPGNLTATSVSNTRLALAWQDNSANEEGFKLERKKGAAGVYAQIALLGPNVKKFADSTLAANTLYFYRVRSFNAGNHSDYSNEADATTLPNKPATPDNLIARTINHTQINLVWRDNAANEDSFKIERKIGAAGQFVQIVAIAANVKNFSDRGLTEKTEYFYRLRAANRGGHSEYSNEATATTFSTPPGAPGNLTATTVSNSRIALAWQDNSANEDGFKIERKKAEGGVYAQIAQVGSEVKKFADSTLAANTLYFYRVRAFNTGNQSNYSNEASATTLQDKPAPPGGLTVTTISHTQINLVWQDRATNEDSFKIERKTGATGKFARIAAIGANVKNFSDRGLTEKTAYFYRLAAANNGGHSEYSNEAKATTFPLPPGAPGNLTATTVSNTRINLAWQDNSANEEGFKIERKKGAAGVYAQIAQVGPEVKKFADSTLAANTLFLYRVRAFNTGNHSDYSNEAIATTLPNKPEAPSDLTATAVSHAQINLVWQDNATNEDSFKIERRIGTAGKYAIWAVLGANLTGYLDRGLAAETAYFYRIRASNPGGDSDFSNEAKATTLPIPPAAPGNLTATTVSYNRINLAWKDSSDNEAGFKVERRIGAAGTFVEAARVGANVTSFADTGLAGNIKYFYRVRAYNIAGHSPYSALASATTLPNPPEAPNNFVAVLVTHNRINLSWQDNSNAEAGFKIERKTPQSGGGTFDEIAVLNANVTSYSNTGLTETTKYFYRIRAYNISGLSAYSEILEVITPAAPPAAPGNLTATTVSHQRLRLAWSDSSGNEAGFKIERKIGLGEIFAEAAKVDANVTNYTDIGLLGNTTYLYRIRAFNAGGHSNYSNPATATTLPVPPAAPGNLIATTVSSARVNLTWEDKSANEDSFRIERKTGAAGAYKLLATLTANTKNFSNFGLTPNTEYFYRIRALNKGGFSEYSNEAGVTTLPLAPAAPKNLLATTVSSIRLNLAWTDSANNETGFEIERRLATSTAYAIVTALAANSNSFADNNLAVNSTYFYRVRAFNAGGYSSYSNEASATTFPTPPNAPGNLLATTVSNTQIKLTWKDNAANEDSFRIERRPGAAGVFKRIAVLAANANHFTDAGLSANTVYFYRLRASNKGGFSGYSNEAEATTLPNPPVAPDNLSATVMSSSRINLTWQDNATNEDSFKIERGSTGSPYAEVARVGADIRNYADNGLTPVTTYFYRVAAANTGGASGYSNEASATTRPTPPLAPANLSATTVSNTQIDLAWQDKSTNEDSFKIERKLGAAGVFKQIVKLGANVKNFSDAGLAPNTSYFYRVRATNTGGPSGYSNEAGTATLPNAPFAPARLRAVPLSQTQVNLAWADSSNNETGFKIERKTITDNYTQIATLGANVTSYVDNGLQQDTEYFYRVRAYNSGGHSDYSGEANAITLPNIPNPPGSLTATTKSSNQLDLVWADSSNNEAGFKIERKVGLVGVFVEIATVGAKVTSFSNLGLIANTRYFFRVRAYNRGGNSAYSNTAEATTLPKPPIAPSGLIAAARPNLQIEIAWQDNSANEDSFKLERRPGPAGAYVQIGKFGQDVSGYLDTGVKAVTPYLYRVRASNTGGHSGYSNEVSVTTLINPPAAPKNFKATTLSNTKILLAWADSSNDEKGFRLERKIAGGVFAEIKTLAPNVQSHIDSSLSGNAEYFYRIYAFNNGGESGYSNETNTRTFPNPPARPTSLVATPVSNTKIGLTWLDNSDNEAGFRIERKTPQSGGTYVPVATAGANRKAFTDTSLAANTGYYYRIRAFNLGGASSYSNETTAKTLPNPPAAPRELAATTINNRQINLAWKDSSNNEIGFKIERKIGLDGTYTDIAVVNTNVKNFADSSLAGKIAYYYRVRAYNAGGHSAYSNETTATTLPNPPTPPNNLTITLVTNRQIRLTWADNSVNESGFRVERKIPQGGTGTYAVVATLNTNNTVYADTGLAAITPYFYRVSAFNPGGSSGYSNEVGATTLPNPPVKPDSLAATPVSHLRIDLKWKDLSNNESGFQIERRIGAGGVFVQIASVGLGVTNFFDTNLAGNKEYFYRVRAFNAGGHSGYTNEVKGVTLPIAPGSLTGNSLSNRRLTIFWTDSSNNESGFRIERRLFETEFVEIGFVGANVHVYADSGLTPNTVYYYRVRAFNFGGRSEYSNEAPVATLPNAPARPRALSVSRRLNLSLELAWADSSNNEIGFAIERKIVADTAYAEVGIVNANVTAYIDTGLVGETRYFYRLRAFNTGGYSLYSNEDNNLTFPTPPATPGDLIATIGGSTRINLLWTDYSTNENGFKIERKLVSDTTYTEIATVNANTTTYSSTGLTEGAAYIYRVLAFNEGGVSNYSNEVNATPADDINLAVNKPTLASGTEASSTTSQAVDGDLTTHWRSSTLNPAAPLAWLRVELHPSSQIIIDRVVIRWHQTFFAPAFEIQTSDNGTSWTTVYATEAGTIGTQEITFMPAPARFVRLYMKRNNKANYRVTEFEVYNGLAKASRHATASEAIIPATVTLRPNYPNPFSPHGRGTTTISYSLPEGLVVTLKVLNIAGQEVATLVDRRQERGIYHVTFNARKLPSGVYFAVLQAGAVREVQRMLLAK